MIPLTTPLIGPTGPEAPAHPDDASRTPQPPAHPRHRTPAGHRQPSTPTTAHHPDHDQTARAPSPAADDRNIKMRYLCSAFGTSPGDNPNSTRSALVNNDVIRSTTACAAGAAGTCFCRMRCTFDLSTPSCSAIPRTDQPDDDNAATCSTNPSSDCLTVSPCLTYLSHALTCTNTTETPTVSTLFETPHNDENR